MPKQPRPSDRSQRSHRGLAAAALALAAVLALAAPALAAPVERPVEREFPAADLRSLELENLAGNVTLVAASGATLRVRGTVFAEASAGESAERLADGLKVEFEAAGGKWIDSPVAGGGGDAQATVLRSRVLAGDPPAAVQIKGPNIADWAKEAACDDTITWGI